VPEEVRKTMKFVFAESVDEVINSALEKPKATVAASKAKKTKTSKATKKSKPSKANKNAKSNDRRR
jgi:hypothetical protein